MRIRDPRVLAGERFADPEPLASEIEVIGRCATDPPLIVRGLLDAIQQRLSPGSGVAELGFGSGWLLAELQPLSPGISISALDLSHEQARRAQTLHGKDVHLILGDMEQLPFRDRSFDVVVSSWTLYFMRDIDIALTEITRCLRPKGRFIAGASAPDHEAEAMELVREAATIALGRELDDPDLGKRFDLETGKDYLRRHFSSVEVRRWPGEMVLGSLQDVMTLWPKWQPESLDAAEADKVRAEFQRIASERLKRDGSLKIRRRDGAFVCDL